MQLGEAQQDKERPVPIEHIVTRDESKAPAVPVPQIADRFTVMVLLYGAYIQLHKRCLQSIVASVPAEQLDLRVACNQVVPATLELLDTLPVTKTYINTASRRKYPAMREMFYDDTIEEPSPWFAWFDDDSYVKTNTWLQTLRKLVATFNPSDRVGMLGQPLYHPVQAKKYPKALSWFREALWHQKRQLRNRRGQSAPNGDCIHFVHGAFWVANLEAVRSADIPDLRLNHNGGDVCIGEQLWQNRWTIRPFNANKQLIHMNAHARRGYKETFPWYA
jgi:hypothetical protein